MSAKYFKMGHPRKLISTKNSKTGNIHQNFMAIEKKLEISFNNIYTAISN